MSVTKRRQRREEEKEDEEEEEKEQRKMECPSNMYVISFRLRDIYELHW